MGKANFRQYAFSVDIEERARFNQAVEANGAGAAKEIRRMVDEFLRDQSMYSEIMESSREKKPQKFATKEVKINAHLDDLALRRFSIICLYANLNVSNVLREMIIAYAKNQSCIPA